MVRELAITARGDPQQPNEGAPHRVDVPESSGRGHLLEPFPGAFELTTRAEEIRARLGKVAPRRMAFAPGSLPEPALDLPDEVRDRPPEPTPEHVAKADSLTRVIRDEELRKVVSKAVAMSLSRDDNDRSFC